MEIVKAKPTVYCHDMLLSHLEMEITVEFCFSCNCFPLPKQAIHD
jgi:hypothetical protein